MKNMENGFEKWLGPTGPEEFESAQEVRDYFSDKNLKSMFGNDAEIDMEEASSMRDWIIERYFE